MMSLMLLALVSQSWGSPVTVGIGDEARSLFQNPVLVAEKNGTNESWAAILKIDSKASIYLTKNSMRILKVTKMSSVLKSNSKLIEVFHEQPNSRSKLLVPVGVICNSENQALTGFDALRWVQKNTECSLNFWTPGHLR